VDAMLVVQLLCQGNVLPFYHQFLLSPTTTQLVGMINPAKADDRRTRNLSELTRMRNLYLCHSDLQQDFSCTSFVHHIERVLFDVRSSQSRDSIHAH